MRKNPLNKGIIMENAAGIGTVTSEMIEARARELAAINGRPSSEPSEADYQQAKRELTGEAEMDPQEESSESVPRFERLGSPAGLDWTASRRLPRRRRRCRGTERECADVRRRRHRSGARSNASGIPVGRGERRTRAITLARVRGSSSCGPRLRQSRSKSAR